VPACLCQTSAPPALAPGGHLLRLLVSSIPRERPHHPEPMHVRSLRVPGYRRCLRVFLPLRLFSRYITGCGNAVQSYKAVVLHTAAAGEGRVLGLEPLILPSREGLSGGLLACSNYVVSNWTQTFSWYATAPTTGRSRGKLQRKLPASPVGACHGGTAEYSSTRTSSIHKYTLIILRYVELGSHASSPKTGTATR